MNSQWTRRGDLVEFNGSSVRNFENGRRSRRNRGSGSNKSHSTRPNRFACGGFGSGSDWHPTEDIRDSIDALALQQRDKKAKHISARRPIPTALVLFLSFVRSFSLRRFPSRVLRALLQVCVCLLSSAIHPSSARRSSHHCIHRLDMCMHPTPSSLLLLLLLSFRSFLHLTPLL